MERYDVPRNPRTAGYRAKAGAVHTIVVAAVTLLANRYAVG